MESFGIGGLTVTGAAGAVLVLAVSVWRSLRRVRAGAAAVAAAGPAAGAPVDAEPAPRRGFGIARAAPAPRLEALAAAQTDLAARLDALAAGQAGGPAGSAAEERLQAMASQLLGLVRDKNATLETALAGLDQLRARMGALEQMGEPAEARALLKRLEARLDEIRGVQAASATALEARMAALEAQSANSFTNPVAELAERLTRLHTRRDAVAEAVLARLAAVETALAGLDPQGALDRFAAQTQELRAALEARVSRLETPGESPFAEISAQLTALYAQKDAAVETVFARLAPLEARLAEVDGRLAGLDPQAALDRFAERLEAVQGRVGALETPGESPFAEISAQLTGLYAQKDAAVETVFARLAPLEARLAEVDGRLAGLDPQAALDRFAERLEAVQGRLGVLETPGESPFAEISAQLAGLYAQKDAAVETVFARLAPLEARLAEVDGRLAGLDPQGALDRFAERLEAVQGRLGALETPGESPFAEISARLAGLYAQKDAAVETVFARLAPLEARLAEVDGRLAGLDPQAALDRFAERLEAVQGRLGALETPGESPFAEISARLAGLYAQKDAAVETVFARLAPLEARLAEVDGRLAGLDPQAALDRFAERLEAVQGRVGALETPGESPFAEISAQLTGLYAQKDAAVETVFARLAPLEARLAEVDGRLAGLDPQAALDRFAERLEAVQGRLGVLETPGESPFAEISAQLAGLYAQKDAAVETVFARLAPLEARLAEVDGRLAGLDPQGALDRFAERLEAVQGRLGALETPGESPFAEISARLAGLYAQKDAAVETVFARLAPLEARLAEVDGRLAGLDPQAALDRFAERLEAVQGRLGALETPGESPFAEISAQLTALYAQKDAAVETVFARLAPLEARLAEVETGLGRVAPLVEADPHRIAAQINAQTDGLAARIEALQWAHGEVAAGLAALKAAGDAAGDKAGAVAGDAAGSAALAGALAGALAAAAPFTEIAGQLTRLDAETDAAVEAVLARLAPLEVRLAGIEARPPDPEAGEARDLAREIAGQMIAMRAAAEATGLFADRLALLEASLPRLSAAQALLVQALGTRAALARDAGNAAGDAGGAGHAAPSSLPTANLPLADIPAVAGAADAPSDIPAMAGAADAPSDIPADIRAANPPAGTSGPEAPAAPEDIWSLPRLISLHHRT